MDYDNRLVDGAPIDREGTLAVARRARRFLIKTGNDVVRIDADRTPLLDADLERYLVHEDGFMRVPVLVVNDLLVRGFTESLYAEALGPASP
jgi:hypothetical protein